ncbi:MAG: ribonuclease HIII [Planctomycetes bacterium]|nr:ribonuclease HIII [Planctomycetota bacterium]
MAQETLVLKLAPRLAGEIERKLAASAFTFRAVPHALFSAKGDGVVATFYASGKFVVQGEGAQMFLARFVGEDAAASAAGTGADGGGRASGSGGSATAPGLGGSATAAGTTGGAASASTGGGSSARTSASSQAGPLIGSDECGKGDYFGPLVVCAVRLEPAEAQALTGGMVRDSKTLSDDACRKLGAALRSRYRHAIARLDPPQYNATWAKLRNVNEVLADLHAQAIRELARPKDHVLVDKFADASLLERRLKGLDIALEQRVRAESVIAVAAASIIAREEFLTALDELSEEAAVDLHKGAGEPVDRSARKYVALHGREKLGQVAKLHFKNTQKLGLAS